MWSRIVHMNEHFNRTANTDIVNTAFSDVTFFSLNYIEFNMTSQGNTESMEKALHIFLDKARPADEQNTMMTELVCQLH